MGSCGLQQSLTEDRRNRGTSECAEAKQKEPHLAETILVSEALPTASWTAVLEDGSPMRLGETSRWP